MKTKTIPTIFGLFLLLTILFSGVWLSTQTTSFSSKASGDCDPQGIQVTNLTHQSFDLSFVTKSSCASVLTVNNRTYQNIKPLSTTHYFRVDNLIDNTEYQSVLIVNGKSISSPDLIVKTGAKPISVNPTSNLAWGKIINQNNQPAPGSIVYLSLVGALPLSAITDDNGLWNISLANSFSDKKNNWFTPTSDQTEDIIVFSPDGIVTQIAHNTSQNDPVPDIIVGQDFISQDQGGGPQTQLPFTDTDNQAIAPVILEINNPQESETIFNLKPQFFGSGPANSTIEIKLESDPVFSGQVVTNSTGSWNWSPPQDLAPGPHTITLTYQDLATGLVKTIKRNFYVEAASNNLAFSASPSATIKPSPTVVLTPTLIPTSTVVPTVRVARPSTTSAVPVTAFPLPAIILIISSFTFVLFSLYYYKRDD